MWFETVDGDLILAQPGTVIRCELKKEYIKLMAGDEALGTLYMYTLSRNPDSLRSILEQIEDGELVIRSPDREQP